MKEKPPKEISQDWPGEAPRASGLKSLKMKANRLRNGHWHVWAPWLKKGVYAETWEKAYWKCLAAKEEQDDA